MQWSLFLNILVLSDVEQLGLVQMICIAANPQLSYSERNMGRRSYRKLATAWSSHWHRHCRRSCGSLSSSTRSHDYIHRWRRARDCRDNQSHTIHLECLISGLRNSKDVEVQRGRDYTGQLEKGGRKERKINPIYRQRWTLRNHQISKATSSKQLKTTLLLGRNRIPVAEMTAEPLDTGLLEIKIKVVHYALNPDRYKQALLLSFWKFSRYFDSMSVAGGSSDRRSLWRNELWSQQLGFRPFLFPVASLTWVEPLEMHVYHSFKE